MKHQKEHQLHMYKFRTTVFCQTAEPTNSLSHTCREVALLRDKTRKYLHAIDWRLLF